MKILKKSSIVSFFSLFAVNFVDMRMIVKDKFINAVTLSIPLLFTGAYMLQFYGVNNEYGIFQAASVIGMIISMAATGFLVDFVLKIETKEVEYYSLLPIPFWGYCLQIIFFYTFYCFVMSIAAILSTILVLYGKNIFAGLSLFKFITVILFAGCLNSSFILFLSSYAKGHKDIEKIILRITVPLSFLGGHQYSWYNLFSFNKFLGYLNLLNPYTYITEAIRSAMISTEGNMPFSISISAMACFAVIFFILAVRKLKKKLDLTY